MNAISSYMVLAVLSVMYFLENYDRYLMAVSIIPYIDYTSYEYSLLSGTIFAICYCGGGLFLALVSDSSPSLSVKRKLIVLSVACLVFSITFATSAIATSFAQQVLIRMTMGLAQSLVTPFSTAVIGSCFTESTRGVAFSVFQLGTYFAFSTSLSMGTYIYDYYGWKAGYIIFGMIGSIYSFFLLPTILLLPQSSPSTNNLQPFNSSGIAHNIILDDDAVMTSYISVAKEEKIDGSEFESSQHSFSKSNITTTSMTRPSNARDENMTTRSPKVFCVRIMHILSDIMVQWNRQPCIYLLCVATGVRLGAGYIWSTYTSVFFSEQWIREQNRNLCTYSFISSVSYNASQHTGQSSICSAAYPYCVPGSSLGAANTKDFSCCKLSQISWHNQGMSHLKLEEYISWVPLAGSAVGNVVGGLLSDRVSRWWGCSGRVLVPAVGNLLAMPFVVLAFLVDFPVCFFCMVGSGFLAESYLGQSLALLTDLTDPQYLVSSVALFMFFITIIAGNMPLVVPAVQDVIAASLGPVTVTVTAMQPWSSDSTAESATTQSYDVQLPHGGARSLQLTLVYVLACVYTISFVLYMACYYCLRRISNRNDEKGDSS